MHTVSVIIDHLSDTSRFKDALEKFGRSRILCGCVSMNMVLVENSVPQSGVDTDVNT